MLPDMTVFPGKMLMPSLNAPVPEFETLILQRGKWAQLYDNGFYPPLGSFDASLGPTVLGKH